MGDGQREGNSKKQKYSLKHVGFHTIEEKSNKQKCKYKKKKLKPFINFSCGDAKIIKPKELDYNLSLGIRRLQLKTNELESFEIVKQYTV